MATEPTTSKRSLKDIVRTPTINVEVHLIDAELHTGHSVPDIVEPTVRPHDPVMYALYEKCLEFGVHFSGNCEEPVKYTLPNAYEPVAKDFPELKILLAGAGRPRNPSQSPQPIWDAVRFADQYENVYLDTADWMRRDREGIELFFSFLRRCFDCDAASKVMYASDFPVLTAMYSERDWIDVLINRAGDYGYQFTDEELARFYSTNALEFLKDVL